MKKQYVPKKQSSWVLAIKWGLGSQKGALRPPNSLERRTGLSLRVRDPAQVSGWAILVTSDSPATWAVLCLAWPDPATPGSRRG